MDPQDIEKEHQVEPGSFTKTAHRLHLLQLEVKDIVATTVVAQATIGKVGVATTTFVFARLKIDSLSMWQC